MTISSQGVEDILAGLRGYPLGFINTTDLFIISVRLVSQTTNHNNTHQFNYSIFHLLVFSFFQSYFCVIYMKCCHRFAK